MHPFAFSLRANISSLHNVLWNYCCLLFVRQIKRSRRSIYICQVFYDKITWINGRRDNPDNRYDCRQSALDRPRTREGFFVLRKITILREVMRNRTAIFCNDIPARCSSRQKLLSLRCLSVKIKPHVIITRRNVPMYKTKLNPSTTRNKFSRYYYFWMPLTSFGSCKLRYKCASFLCFYPTVLDGKILWSFRKR